MLLRFLLRLFTLIEALAEAGAQAICVVLRFYLC
jgi:hypothetical protein